MEENSPQNSVRDAIAAVEKLQGRVHSLIHESERIEKTIRTMDSVVDPIVKSADSVEQIARQTLMVSINATIEAARVGETGAAFGVVAEEVGSLAKEVQTTAQAMTALAAKNREMADNIRQTFDTFLSELGEIITDRNVERSLSQVMLGIKDAKVVGTSSVTTQPTARQRIAYDHRVMTTGVQSVDQQHKELIDMINRMVEMVEQGRGVDEIRHTLDFLGDYVVRHFAHEEAEMAKRNCPVAAINRQQHAKLLEKYQSWRADFEASGGKLTMVLDLYDFLATWLKQHVCKTDTCLRQKQSSTAATERLRSRHAGSVRPKSMLVN